MKLSRIDAMLIVALALFGSHRVEAQVADPALQIQSQVVASGMTADQLRARLKAAGLPEAMLDPYLPGATGAPPAPDSKIFDAVRLLGLPAAAPLAPGQVPVAQPPAAQAAPAPQIVAPEGPSIFGLDVFRRTTSQFDPTAAGAADAAYKVGPGDVLVLILTGGVEAAYNLEITRDGFIVVPQVGQLYVANLTMEQIRSLLLTSLSRAYSGINRDNTGSTKFSVSIGRVRTNQIFVIGEAQDQGSYQVSALGTLLTALYAAGGPSVTGSMRAIEVRRGGKTVATFDLYDYLLAGNSTQDIRLENGDVVFIPFHGPRVQVKGEVGRPSTFELKSGEGLREVLHMAGDFTPNAARQRVQVERILPPAQRATGGRDRVVIDVVSDAFAAGSAPTYPLESGDVVSVFAISDRVRNRISVGGDVWTPGPQGLAPGMRLSDAIRAAGGVKPDAYMDDILITRLGPDSLPAQLHARLRDLTGALVEDITLREDDEIRVFSRNDMRNIRDVAITGAVRHPGPFGFREGMTLRDLVLVAGGYIDSTNVRDEVLLSRIQPDLSRTDERLSLRASTADGSALTLRPGDEISLSTFSQYRPDRFVSITGSVNSGGQIAFHDGMTLRDAVSRAGGVTEAADLRAAEIARLPADRTGGKLAETIRVPLDSTYLFEKGPAGKYSGPPGIQVPPNSTPEVPLKPYDNVVIFRQPNWLLQQTVIVQGEVKFPAEYSLLHRTDRITDIVERAGGVTAQAYPGGATLTRREGDVGRININLDDILKNPRSRNNLVLVAGDQLVIPHFLPTIRVTGGVNAPTSVAYKPGATLTYYVDQAGGFARLGDKSRSFATDANGRTQPFKEHRFWPDHNPVPDPGATIVVPVTDPQPATDWASVATSVAQLLATAMTLVAILARK